MIGAVREETWCDGEGRAPGGHRSCCNETKFNMPVSVFEDDCVI